MQGAQLPGISGKLETLHHQEVSASWGLTRLLTLKRQYAIVVADRAAEVGFTDLECGQGGHVRGILAGVGLISEGLTLGGPFGNASPSGPFDLVSPGWMSLALWNPGWFFAFFPGPASWRGANSVRL